MPSSNVLTASTVFLSGTNSPLPSYTISSTDTAYAPTRRSSFLPPPLPRASPELPSAGGIVLRISFAMSGADLGYATTRYRPTPTRVLRDTRY
eukprot:3936491-Rhodomonas_salina.2